MRKIILLTMCTAIIFWGCAEKSGKGVSTEEASGATESLAEETPTETAAEASAEPTEGPTQFNAQNAYVEIPEGALSQEESAELLRNRLKTYGIFEDNQRISFEGTTVINHRECYQFRRYDSFDDHRAALGWYAVNPVTGECLDTTTEPVPLYYRFEITKEGTEIYEKYARVPFQIIVPSYSFYSDKFFDELSSEPLNLIKVNDFDFDGYEDIAVQVWLSANQAGFEYYRFNPDTKMFEGWEEMSNLTYHADVNFKNKTVSFFSKNGSLFSWDDTYKWIGDKLVMVSSKRRYYDYDAKDIFMDYLEYDEDGIETLVKREKYITDENWKCIGTEEVEIE